MSESPVESPTEDRDVAVPGHLAQDEMNILLSGGNYSTDEDAMAAEFLNGGDHFDDITHNMRRTTVSTDTLPRERMHAIVANRGLSRPIPKQWVARTPK